MVTTPRGPDNDLILGEFTDRKTLRFVRDFPHPPKIIWETLSDGAQYSIWLWQCTRFEAKAGGAFCFDISGQIWEGRIKAFEPPHLLDLGGRIRFELFDHNEGCRLILTLTRPPTGWSPIALAGFQAWIGRLTRLIAKTPQDETDRWAQEGWDGMFPVYERQLRLHVSNGEKIIWRLHFGENDAALTAESIGQLDALAQLLATRPDLNVVIDGFGDDPCDYDDSVKLCAARMAGAAAHLRQTGIAPERILTGYTLGNYHHLVPRDTAAGRAFNRRIELRPTY